MRLFFALPLPEGIARIQTEVQQRAEQLGLAAKWPRPSGLHLTLAFLGEQAEDTLSRLLRIGQDAGACPPFELRTTGLGGFPKAEAARILWLGVAPEPALDELCARLRRGLLGAGVAFDAKPFRPHITLGRLPGSRDITPLQGPRYQVVAAFPFTA